MDLTNASTCCFSVIAPSGTFCVIPPTISLCLSTKRSAVDLGILTSASQQRHCPPRPIRERTPFIAKSFSASRARRRRNSVALAFFCPLILTLSPQRALTSSVRRSSTPISLSSTFSIFITPPNLIVGAVKDAPDNGADSRPVGLVVIRLLRLNSHIRMLWTKGDSGCSPAMHFLKPCQDRMCQNPRWVRWVGWVAPYSLSFI